MRGDAWRGKAWQGKAGQGVAGRGFTLKKDIAMKKTRFEKSADTAVIENMFLQASVGDVISYDDMTRALGRDVRTHCASNVQSAKRLAEAAGIVLGSIKNVGYQRLDDSQIIDTAESSRKRIMRKSRRSLRRLSSVEFAKLSDDDKRKHTTFAAQMGAMNYFSTATTKKKIASNVNGKDVLAIGDTLKLFTD